MKPSEAGHLAETLTHVARHIPFYRQYFGKAESTRNLHEFPVIDADLVYATPDAFYQADRFPDFILTTGGTSGKPGRFILLNYDELDALFHDLLEVPPGGFTSAAFDAVAILLTDQQHGLLLPPRYGQPVLPLPLENGQHLALVEHFLREGIVVDGRRRRVQELYGSITKLRALTAYAEWRKLDMAALGIRRILSVAFYTSSYWRARLERLWGAEVTVGYGLTEFLGALALPCAHCPGCHMPDSVHSEFLDEDLTGPVSAGPALLVLSTLVPYRTVMPLIRYNTQDLVEVLEPCPVLGRPGFHLLGRRSASLLLPDRQGRRIRFGIGPFDILEALELPAVVDAVKYDDSIRAIYGWGLGGSPDYARVGYPNFHARVGEDHNLHVLVEVNDADLDEIPSDVHPVAQLILQRLRAVLQERLGESPADDTISVKTVSPGWLQSNDLPITIV